MRWAELRTRTRAAFLPARPAAGFDCQILGGNVRQRPAGGGRRHRARRWHRGSSPQLLVFSSRPSSAVAPARLRVSPHLRRRPYCPSRCVVAQCASGKQRSTLRHGVSELLWCLRLKKRTEARTQLSVLHFAFCIKTAPSVRFGHLVDSVSARWVSACERSKSKCKMQNDER